MPKQKVRKQNRSDARAFGKRRAFLALGLILSLIAATAILAQRGERKEPASRDQGSVSQSGEVTPSSLTSPSLWSKEYIHGPGGKVIATEQRLKFDDVVDGSDFYEDIYRIAARRVTVGCTATNYCPDLNVTREQMAAFIMRALGEHNPPTPQTQRFSDVPPSNIFYNFIDRLAAVGITAGCTATTYCPTATVTHDQMAVFMMRARGEPNPPLPGSQRFADVPPGHWAYNFIERMGALDIWQGQGCPAGPGNYCPNAPVTRRQMAHILVKAFGI